MTDKSESLGSVEEALFELQLARRAGVFRDTPLPPTGEWADRPLILDILRRVRIWTPLSAAALLALGTWGWMLSTHLSNIGALRDQRSVSTSVSDVAADQVDFRQFAHCLSGPGQALPDNCEALDFDVDGDADLADWSAFQLALAANAHGDLR